MKFKHLLIAGLLATTAASQNVTFATNEDFNPFDRSRRKAPERTVPASQFDELTLEKNKLQQSFDEQKELLRKAQSSNEDLETKLEAANQLAEQRRLNLEESVDQLSAAKQELNDLGLEKNRAVQEAIDNAKLVLDEKVRELEEEKNKAVQAAETAAQVTLDARVKELEEEKNKAVQAATSKNDTVSKEALEKAKAEAQTTLEQRVRELEEEKNKAVQAAEEAAKLALDEKVKKLNAEKDTAVKLVEDKILVLQKGIINLQAEIATSNQTIISLKSDAKVLRDTVTPISESFPLNARIAAQGLAPEANSDQLDGLQENVTVGFIGHYHNFVTIDGVDATPVEHLLRMTMPYLAKDDNGQDFLALMVKLGSEFKDNDGSFLAHTQLLGLNGGKGIDRTTVDAKDKKEEEKKKAKEVVKTPETPKRKNKGTDSSEKKSTNPNIGVDAVKKQEEGEKEAQLEICRRGLKSLINEASSLFATNGYQLNSESLYNDVVDEFPTDVKEFDALLDQINTAFKKIVSDLSIIQTNENPFEAIKGFDVIELANYITAPSTFGDGFEETSNEISRTPLEFSELQSILSLNPFTSAQAGLIFDYESLVSVALDNGISIYKEDHQL